MAATSDSKKKKKSRKSQPAPSKYDVRAFLIGASPDATPAHTRETLKAWGVDPARDLLIGVDGGVRVWLEAGYKPHLAMGDWDSFSGAEARKVLTSIHHITLPLEKDRSDLFFSACSALGAGATQLICLGVTGGRPDHHFAALCDLSRIASGESGAVDRVCALGPEGEYHFLSGANAKWKGNYPTPRTISVFSMLGPSSGVTLKGFKYPMKGERLECSSQGLSNRSWAPSCEISVKSGVLLVLIPAERLVI